MRKIHLAHLVHDLGFAGKEKGIMKISSRLDRSRFEVSIIVLRKVFRDAVTPADRFHIIELNRKPGNDLRLFYQLAQLFKQHQFDIIYTHSWNTLVEGYFGAALTRVPAKIHGEHGTFEHSLIKDKLQSALWGRFDAVTVVADALRQKMRDEFGYTGDNIQVIHNGIDTQKFYPSAELRQRFRQQLGLNQEFLVGTVGRFHPVKDHFTLFRAFARFRTRVPNARLLMVGRETYSHLMEKYQGCLNDLGIREQVIFHPPTTRVEEVFNAMDAFVLSSKSEGCSNVILEAMACGVPVVATRAGGNPELVQDGETGLLFEVKDTDELAKKLLKLYSNSELYKKLQLAGPRVIQKEFSLDQAVMSYEKLYAQLMQEKKNNHNCTSIKG